MFYLNISTRTNTLQPHHLLVMCCHGRLHQLQQRKDVQFIKIFRFPPERGKSLFYTLNDHILQHVGTISYLGVTLYEDLTFVAHVGNVHYKKEKSNTWLHKKKPQGLPITP